MKDMNYMELCLESLRFSMVICYDVLLLFFGRKQGAHMYMS